jgi:hypothetical protein
MGGVERERQPTVRSRLVRPANTLRCDRGAVAKGSESKPQTKTPRATPLAHDARRKIGEDETKALRERVASVTSKAPVQP